MADTEAVCSMIMSKNTLMGDDRFITPQAKSFYEPKWHIRTLSFHGFL